MATTWMRLHRSSITRMGALNDTLRETRRLITMDILALSNGDQRKRTVKMGMTSRIRFTSKKTAQKFAAAYICLNERTKRLRRLSRLASSGLSIYIHIARNNLGHISVCNEAGNALVIEYDAG